MKKMIFFNFAAVFVLICAVCVEAKEEKAPKEEIPAGMEVVYIGNTKSVVPAGTKIHKSEGFMVLESTKEYVGRRFKEVQDKLSVLEKEQQELKTAIDVIQTEISAKAQDLEKLQKDIRRNTKKIEVLEEEVWRK